MIKYFTYNISDFKGYRARVEESNIKCFSKIIHSGFKIVTSSTSFIHYEIELKLIRCLKLKRLEDSIRKNSVEDRILELIERSKEVEKNNPYAYYSSYRNYDYDYYEDNEYDKFQNKERNKYQSKIYAQKAKNYENKARFRK